jgi:hypothetical protein
MKFSLKKLAAVAVLAAAATGASAAIDSGAQGNGELFFNAWDANTSFTFDLNVSINDFDLAMAAPGLLNQSWGAAQGFLPAFSDWLATTNAAELQWNILSTDTSGQRRMLTTVGHENELPATNNDATSLRTGAGSIRDFATQASLVMVGDVAITNSNAAPSYAGVQGPYVFGGFTFDSTGNLAANSYANGLVFQKTTANATGTALGINTAYVDETLAVKSWLDADGLHIAAVDAIPAVPEPSETAMLLAGLGLIGFAARRKARRA